MGTGHRAALALTAIAALAPAAYGAPTKPAVITKPASPQNYTNASRGAAQIDMLVIHDIEGTAPGAASWFANPAARASAHYSVHYDGTIYQSVQDEDVAWHAGNSSYNARSIGLEHSGYASKNLFTDDEYRASAKLAAYLCAKYGIPIDRQHIIAHAEVPDPNKPGKFGGASNHTDPGKFWDWNLYMGYVRQYAGAAPPPPAKPDYASDFVGQSAKTLTLTAGDTAVVWFEFKNTGAKSWIPTGPSNLGTESPKDRSSPFFTQGNWLGQNRPTAVDKTTAGGAVGRYSFVITAPAVTKATTYKEVFRQVQDGVTWFGPNASIEITVNPRATAPPPPPPPPGPTGTRGELLASCDPSDAHVYLSYAADGVGRRLGPAGSRQSPASFKDLAPGPALVTFTRPGYGTHTVATTIVAGQPVRVDGALVRPRFSTFTRATDVAGVKVAGRAVPVACDLDRDGMLDLVVGARDGSVTLCRGSKRGGLEVGAGAPLQAAGQPVRAGANAAPAVCDWDEDGALDLLVGGDDGAVVLHRGDGKGGFLAGAALPIPKAAGGDASPFAVDLLQEGALGLLVGQGDGTVRYHRRWGGQLDAGTLVADANGNPIRTAGPARAVAVELKKTGQLDLVVGGSGEARLYVRLALPARGPLYQDAGPFVAWSQGARAAIASSSQWAATFVDANSDGRVDLVLGDGAGARHYLAEALDGDVDDTKKVDARDLIRLSRAIGSTRGDAAYDPTCDANEDGKIDAADRAIVTKNLGGQPR